MKYIKLFEDFESETETESESTQIETETEGNPELKDFEELTIDDLRKKGIKIGSYFCDGDGKVIEINGDDTYDFLKKELPHIIHNKER